MLKRIVNAIFLAQLIAIPLLSYSQAQEYRLSKQDQKQIIDTTVRLFEQYYIDSKKVDSVKRVIYKLLEENSYKDLGNITFIRSLSQDLRYLFQDNNLNYYRDYSNSLGFTNRKFRRMNNFELNQKNQRIIWGNNTENLRVKYKKGKIKDITFKMIKKAKTYWSKLKEETRERLEKQHGTALRDWHNTEVQEMDWGKLYLTQNRIQEKGTYYDKRFDQPYYYEHKRGTKSLIGKHITLKQAQDNFGLSEVRIMEGNVAYLRVKYWANPMYMDKEALANTMNMLTYTESIILDLRDTQEGRLEMIEAFCAYFFPKKTNLLLAEQYIRYKNEYKKFYTTKKVRGYRLDKKKIYILVNQNTKGTAELVAQVLRKHRQAELVGEKTAGSMHLVRRYTINDYTSTYCFVPDTRIIYPENWHKIGLTPDHAVGSAEALDKAWELAIRKQMANPALGKPVLEQFLEEKKPAFPLTESQLQKWVGKYAHKTQISLENGVLYLEYFGKKYKLKPLAEDKFWVENSVQLSHDPFFYSSKYSGMALNVAYLRFNPNTETKKNDLILIFSNTDFTVFQAE